MSKSKPGETDVRRLFESCSESEKAWSRNPLNKIGADLLRHLTFRGPLFYAFSESKSGSNTPDADRAARYMILLNLLRGRLSTNERLAILTQWAWAEANITPEDFLGSELASRLASETRKRMANFPINDLYYAGLVQIWLPYIARLFRDAEGASSAHDPKQKLLRLGHDPAAVEIVKKTQRSPVAFTCEWLAGRTGIAMKKPRQDADISRTLKNAYSRIFGSGAPRKLICTFCGGVATGEFETADHIFASHCNEHRREFLPGSASEAWTDSEGRLWWLSGSSIRCQRAD
ncbi:MAG: hypothetical protein ACRD4C_04500 [Candidatus Acidiferrales bacterium]